MTEVDQVFPTIVGHGSSATTSAATGDLGHVVNAAMRDVLGWRPRVEDPKAFVDALTASFRLSTREGHTEAVFVPRGYAVQADLGAVTGGQASLYRRAQVSRTEILRILDGLRPLRPDADADDMESYRTIVRGAVQSLVDELGAAGGPRVRMVDTYFNGLTGAQRAGHPETPDSVSGHLGILRERFGLTNAHVNTPDEEAVRTSFWTLVEMITDLQSSWKSHRRQFSGSAGQGFLGTELIVLSRLMEAAADQVDEFEEVLESVMITASERRTVYLDTERGLTLDGLLRWLHSFLSEEGRRIAQDTGRDGIVSALAPTAVALLKTFKSTLADRVDDDYSRGGRQQGATMMRRIPTGIGTTLPAGMYAARTRIAIASLQRLLMQLASTAQRLGRYPGVVLFEVAVRPVHDDGGLSLVEFRGIGLQPSYQPAFISVDAPYRGSDGYIPQDLVTAERNSVSASDDTLAGLFRTDEVREALGDVAIGDYGVIVPAEDVALAIVDSESGSVVHAPEPTTWPSHARADRRPRREPTNEEQPIPAGETAPVVEVVEVVDIGNVDVAAEAVPTGGQPDGPLDYPGSDHFDAADPSPDLGVPADDDEALRVKTQRLAAAWEPVNSARTRVAEARAAVYEVVARASERTKPIKAYQSNARRASTEGTINTWNAKIVEQVSGGDDELSLPDLLKQAERLIAALADAENDLGAGFDELERIQADIAQIVDQKQAKGK